METNQTTAGGSPQAPTSQKIYQAIPAIMKELEAVGRDKRNQAQGFNYRGIDDLYNALQPLMAKHGVFTAPLVEEERRVDKPTKSGGVQVHVILRIRYRFYCDDGSFFDTVLIGEGMDSGDKASNKAESVAHKYALTQVFAVRTEDQVDPDSQQPEATAPPKKAAPPAKDAAPPYVAKTQAPAAKAAEKRTSANTSHGDWDRAAPGWEKHAATEPQKKRMWALAKEAGYDKVQLGDLLYSMFGDEIVDPETNEVTTKALTKNHMEKIFHVLEKDAKSAK